MWNRRHHRDGDLARPLTLEAVSLQIIVRQGAPARAFKIIKLPVAQSPHEGCEPNQAKQQSQWQQKHKNIHANRSIGQRARKAFKVTITEEPDIAKAAMRGVASPAIATGTATRL